MNFSDLVLGYGGNPGDNDVTISGTRLYLTAGEARQWDTWNTRWGVQPRVDDHTMKVSLRLTPHGHLHGLVWPLKVVDADLSWRLMLDWLGVECSRPNRNPVSPWMGLPSLFLGSATYTRAVVARDAQGAERRRCNAITHLENALRVGAEVLNPADFRKVLEEFQAKEDHDAL